MTRKKQDGRTSDLTFSWVLTSLGQEWKIWQQFASEWLLSKHNGIHERIHALIIFLKTI